MALSNEAERRLENLQKPVRSILFLDKALVWRFGVSLVISSSLASCECVCCVCLCVRTYSSYDLLGVFCRACRNLRMCVWLAGSQSRLQNLNIFPLHSCCFIGSVHSQSRGWAIATAEERRRFGGRRERPVCWVGWGWVHSSSSDLEGQYLQTTLYMRKYTHPHGEGERTGYSTATRILIY